MGGFFVKCIWAKIENFLPNIFPTFHFHTDIPIMCLNVTFVCIRMITQIYFCHSVNTNSVFRNCVGTCL